jgi:hypothetical protein
MLRLVAVLACGLLAALVVAMPAFAAEPVRAVDSSDPLGTERLSDEFSVSRWATPVTSGKLRTRPTRRARPAGRLRFATEDGKPEVYLVLRSLRERTGRVWLQVRVPGRPNGRIAWVEREGLGRLNVVRTHLRINRRTLHATLYRDGRRVWRAPVAIGASGTPTPGGHFWIRELLRGGGGAYGPWAFGTAAYSRLSDWPGGGVVGIHGTNQPGLIPGRPSHGCVRMRNRDIGRLVRLMPIGTPVRIV